MEFIASIIGDFGLIVVNCSIFVLESGCVTEKNSYALICTRACS